MRLPAEIEHIVLRVTGMPDFTKSNAGIYKKRLNRIRNEMYELSNDFAQSRPTKDKYEDAYLLYNFPMNMMKVMAITKQLCHLYPTLFAQHEKMRILDVGCGAGAGIVGLYYCFQNQHRFSFTGIDSSRHMLKQCRAITNQLKKNNPDFKVSLLEQIVAHNFFQRINQEHSIILFVNSLAEIFDEDTIPAHFIDIALQHLSDYGIIIIIEPALKSMSRRLMGLRKEILKRKRGHVLFPCLHSSSCPLSKIRNQKEWCHHNISWQPPYFMEHLNQGLNREIDQLKFSSLVIANKDYSRIHKNGFLVISHLLLEKGKKKCFLCTPLGRIEVVRLNKSKGKKNSAFDDVNKGDIISLKDFVRTRSHYWQIVENTSIGIIRLR